MKRAGQALAICVVVLGGFWATSTRAHQAPDAKAALAKDGSCITCHAGTGHVADIYQSRHGNKADPRTPGCVNCHGASDKHMTDPPGIAPDVVFAATSKRRSPATARSASCLSCHASHVLPRTLWAGSQHETRGVSCTDCHNIHAADQKVMNKATQAEVCVTCHRAQRAEIRHLSGHPLAKTGIGGVITTFRLGPLPHEAAAESLRLFMTEVAPNFR